jgi:hypothetical protein
LPPVKVPPGIQVELAVIATYPRAKSATLPESRPALNSGLPVGKMGNLIVPRLAHGALALTAMLLANLPVLAKDDFPIAGTYLRDMVCVGNGSQRPDLLVTITSKRIESTLANCNILNHRRNGKAISAHVECKMPGNQLILGDVTFTIRDDKTVEFEDQDHTSDATLHRCAP